MEKIAVCVNPAKLLASLRYAFTNKYTVVTELMQNARRAKASFVVRLSSKSQRYTAARQPLERFREGLVWYWPEKAQNQQRPPLRLRRIRVRGKKKQAVWLLTNLLQPERCSRM